MALRFSWLRNLFFFDHLSYESRPVAPCVFDEDFLVKALDTTNLWTLRDNLSATETLKADQAGGVVELALTNANEIQYAGIDMGDERPFAIAKKLIAEFRARFTVLPTGAAIAVIGMAGNFNAAIDTVAESCWFRADGSGAITVENDDTTNETSKVATGVTLVANEWAVFRIDFTDPASVKFYINGNQVAASTTFNMNQVPALVLQPYVQVNKAASTNVGTLELDYVRCWQER